MLRQYHFCKNNQQGRSLLEIIAVIVIIILLTIGGTWMHRYATGARTSSTIYEDILAQGEALRNRGGATNKNIYDTSIGGRSRTGTRMAFCPDESGNSSKPCPVRDAETFEITVFDVSQEACQFLAQKNWPTDKVARVRINNDWYDPHEIKCGTEDAFDITILFWSNSATSSDRSDSFIIPSLCKDGCLSCQQCRNNICVNKCTNGSYCVKTDDSPDGECASCPSPTGTYCGTEPTNNLDKRGCPRNVYQECEGDQVCENHECITCKTQGTLGPGDSCTIKCPNECQTGLMCVNGKCGATGTGCGSGDKNSSCSNECLCKEEFGLTCRGGSCQCGSGTLLEGYSCRICPNSCGTNLICDSGTKKCVRSNTGCSNCGVCEKCVAGTCQTDNTKFGQKVQDESCDDSCECEGNLVCHSISKTCITDCSTYTLNECPTNGVCSDCTDGTTKYKLDSCDSGHYKSGNSCVAISCSAYTGTGIADQNTYTGGIAGKANDGVTDCRCPTDEAWTNNACVQSCPLNSTYETSVPNGRMETETTGCYCNANKPYWDPSANNGTGACSTIPNCSAAMLKGFGREVMLDEKYSVSGNNVTWNPKNYTYTTDTLMAPTSDLDLTGCNLTVNGFLTTDHLLKANNLIINGSLVNNSTMHVNSLVFNQKEASSRNSNICDLRNNGVFIVDHDIQTNRDSSLKCTKDGVDDKGELIVKGNVTSNEMWVQGGPKTHIYGNLTSTGGVMGGGMTVDGNVRATNATHHAFSESATIHGSLYAEATNSDTSTGYKDGIWLGGNVTVDGDVTAIASHSDSSAMKGGIQGRGGTLRSKNGNITVTGNVGVYGSGTIIAEKGSITVSGNKSGGIWSSGNILIEAKGKIKVTTNNGWGILLKGILRAGGGLESSNAGSSALLIQGSDDSLLVSCADVKLYGGKADAGLNALNFSEIQIKGQLWGSSKQSSATDRKYNTINFPGSRVGDVHARSLYNSSTGTAEYYSTDGCTQGAACLRTYEGDPNYTPQWCLDNGY